MEGRIPIRLDSKISLKLSPLDVILGFWANKAMAEIQEDHAGAADAEAASLTLATMLANYDVVSHYSFADLCGVLEVCT
jgi:hypothetical protein